MDELHSLCSKTLQSSTMMIFTRSGQICSHVVSIHRLMR